jgi:membrane protein DedA with SNARE-associated domain
LRFILNWPATVTPYVEHYGYAGVFCVIFLESLGLPLPGETFLVLASLCAAKGMLDPAALIIVSILATFLSNLLSYGIGYWKGTGIITKYGKYVFITEKRFHKAEHFFKKYKSMVIVFARFIPGLRQLNGFIMGTIKMPLNHYALFNLLGAILWVLCYVGIPLRIINFPFIFSSF